MVVIIGFIIVTGCVLGGFSISGGQIGALIHPAEILTIGGASIGALVVMSPLKVLKDLMKGVIQSLKGSPFNKVAYEELFKAMYELFRLARRSGFLSLEPHLSNPHELKTMEAEHHAPIGVLTKTADALPGFGIVAAVLGIVITMGAIDGPVEEIGHKVGAALVGTFLGILLSYGFFGPMATKLEFMGESEMAYFKSIATIITGFVNDMPPKVAIELARRGLSSDMRPSQAELEALLKSAET
jgi:chemotaxis protein MotA